MNTRRSRLVVDDGSLGSSGRVLDNGVLGYGVGGGVVSSLSSKHALLDSWAGRGTGVRSIEGSVLLSVGVVDGTCSLGVFAGLQLESGQILSREHEKVNKEEDGLGEDIKNTVEDHLGIGGDLGSYKVSNRLAMRLCRLTSVGNTPCDRV